MRHYLKLFLYIVLFTSQIISCTDKEESVLPFLTIEEKMHNFTAEPSSKQVPIKTSFDNWQASVDNNSSSWLSAKRSGANWLYNVLCG